jgi:hypothetical protein
VKHTIIAAALLASTAFSPASAKPIAHDQCSGSIVGVFVARLTGQCSTRGSRPA